MTWETKGEARVLRSGSVNVGSVYPPTHPGGQWRWRIWVNGRQAADEGKRADQEAAMAEVEKRFAAFLGAAALAPKLPAGPDGRRG